MLWTYSDLNVNIAHGTHCIHQTSKWSPMTLSICHIVASRLVPWCRRNQCHSCVCSQEVMAHFTLVSVATRWAVSCFLVGTNRWQSPGPILPVGLFTALWLDDSRPLPAVLTLMPSDFDLFEPRKKHLVGNQSAVDTNMRQAVTWLQSLHIDYYYASTGFGAKMGQLLKYGWCLCVRLVCTVCYTFSMCTPMSE